MFNDVVVVKSWHDLGAHLERRGKKKGPPLLVKYACSSSPLCVDLLSTGLIFIVDYLVSAVIQFNGAGEHVQRLITILRALIVGNVVSTRLKRLNGMRDRI